MARGLEKCQLSKASSNSSCLKSENIRILAVYTFTVLDTKQYLLMYTCERIQQVSTIDPCISTDFLEKLGYSIPDRISIDKLNKHAMNIC